MIIRTDSPRYKWVLVLVLFFVAALNYADRVALMAVFPLLRKDLGMSDVALAAVGSLFLWSYGLCSPWLGFWETDSPGAALSPAAWPPGAL